ncbi:uncharacterized protein KY384_003877 [Bacidia gigantensis]|uniref:uncharacterized protein n=1 Tax=Bacidia gigantensis TaxID=2732470 RepID=UPI001D03BBD5|nr:uncharacterized protein KY384_003877 [Bacidia gigantensis]KAG8532236.1 hypothetical protein KY384_003877 [Bacidia gigantensis]
MKFVPEYPQKLPTLKPAPIDKREPPDDQQPRKFVIYGPTASSTYEPSPYHHHRIPQSRSLDHIMNPYSARDENYNRSATPELTSSAPGPINSPYYTAVPTQNAMKPSADGQQYTLYQRGGESLGPTAEEAIKASRSSRFEPILPSTNCITLLPKNAITMPPKNHPMQNPRDPRPEVHHHSPDSRISRTVLPATPKNLAITRAKYVPDLLWEDQPFFKLLTEVTGPPGSITEYRCTWADILMRMEPETIDHTMADEDRKRNCLNMLGSRTYYPHYKLTSWFIHDHNTGANRAGIFSLLSDWHIANNTSRGISPGYINPALGEIPNNRIVVPAISERCGRRLCGGRVMKRMRDEGLVDTDYQGPKIKQTIRSSERIQKMNKGKDIKSYASNESDDTNDNEALPAVVFADRLNHANGLLNPSSCVSAPVPPVIPSLNEIEITAPEFFRTSQPIIEPTHGSPFVGRRRSRSPTHFAGWEEQWPVGPEYAGMVNGRPAFHMHPSLYHHFFDPNYTPIDPELEGSSPD